MLWSSRGRGSDGGNLDTIGGAVDEMGADVRDGGIAVAATCGRMTAVSRRDEGSVGDATAISDTASDMTGRGETGERKCDMDGERWMTSQV